jgi:hypothetical protein
MGEDFKASDAAKTNCGRAVGFIASISDSSRFLCCILDLGSCGVRDALRDLNVAGVCEMHCVNGWVTGR